MKKLPLFAILILCFSVFAVYADSTPPKINSFSATASAGGSVDLEWTISDNDELKGYEIKKNGVHFLSELTPYKLFINYYSDTQTKQGEQYTYELIAIDTSNLTAIKTVTVNADSQPPKITTEKSIFSNKNELTFETDEDSTCIAGFYADNMDEVQGNYTKSHTIKGIFKEGINNLYVKCKDNLGNIMYTTALIEFTLDSEAPVRVPGLKAELDGGKVKLSWQALYGEETSQYIVYKGESQNFIQKISTVPNPEYIDEKNLTFGKTYYYAVSAIDLAGNEGQKSNIASVKITSSPISLELSSPDADEIVVNENDEKITVKGTTSKVSDITITANKKTYKTLSNNSFEIDIPLESSKTVLEIKATDNDGNLVSKTATILKQAETVTTPEVNATAEKEIEETPVETEETSSASEQEKKPVVMWWVIAVVFIIALAAILVPRIRNPRSKSPDFGLDSYIAKRRELEGKRKQNI